MQNTPEKNRNEQRPVPQSPFMPISGASSITVREYEKSLDALKKENFDLKLRVFHLEDRLQSTLPASLEEAAAENIELRIKNDELKKRNGFLEERAGSADSVQECDHEEEIDGLNRKINALQNSLATAREEVAAGENEKNALRKKIDFIETQTVLSSPTRGSLDFLETRLLKELEQTTKHFKSLETKHGEREGEIEGLRGYCISLQNELETTRKFIYNVVVLLEAERQAPSEDDPLETQLLFLKEIAEQAQWEIHSLQRKTAQLEGQLRQAAGERSLTGEETQRLKQEHQKTLAEKEALAERYREMLAAAETQRAENEAAKREFDTKITQLTMETIPTLAEERDAAEEKLQSALQQIEAKAEKLKQHEESRMQLESQIYETRQTLFSLQKKNAALDSEKKKLGHELKTAEDALERSTARVSELANETRRLAQETEATSQVKDRLKEEFEGQLGEAHREISARTVEVARLRDAYSALKTENDRIKTDVVTLRTNSMRLKDMASDQSEKLRELELLKERYKTDREKYTEKAGMLSSNAEMLKEQLERKNRQIAELNEKSVMLERKTLSTHRECELQKKKLKKREEIITEALKKLETINHPLFDGIAGTIKKQRESLAIQDRKQSDERGNS
ncbi:MAG: uncharacterized protein A8A55_1958 [Amphiamblys sp. WSBS2006]|nr:MAG: uncharacterized protein A8A55_1958 [Amphiamblys sp. WSBS2006]